MNLQEKLGLTDEQLLELVVNNILNFDVSEDSKYDEEDLSEMYGKELDEVLNWDEADTFLIALEAKVKECLVDKTLLTGYH